MLSVNRAQKEANVPITCKIRVFPDMQHTIKYAQMLEAAGCQLLTVHGRTREQKGPLTGLASWEHIKAVKSSVKVPVFANGNIQNISDVSRCFEKTGVDGVMIAEGSLHNPALFHGINPTVWDVSLEYLELVEKYPCPMSYVRGHMFKLCHHCLVLDENKEVRQKFAVANSVLEFKSAIMELKNKYEKTVLEDCVLNNVEKVHQCPPWVCQPYVRPPPVDSMDKIKMLKSEESSEATSVIIQKRPLQDCSISKKKQKKLLKNPDKQFGEKKKIFEMCSICSNPKGTKCEFQLCKACCREKSYNEILDCTGHRFLFKTKKLKASEVVEDLVFNEDIIIETH
ncbi:tRNA-dihydrouridine(16/17) synthase [NAD(P)(+)]-like isoform X2 [Uloborus diversus]|uniref:tRNA-dihydrouridine(16/17) synthase [NAD(P)(+)]-like isoform X2 n=1 Tax=Uloborus diversus TaxID=327109 RepID=UPI0024099A4F|nr:tRNA-dihydrouridine(16/17) synthase [NAD(P)(+)]-like isoform X2 [Uloborus diversus]